MYLINKHITFYRNNIQKIKKEIHYYEIQSHLRHYQIVVLEVVKVQIHIKNYQHDVLQMKQPL